MEPQIRYVKSADGTRIGYFTLGMGRPLVYVTNLGFRPYSGAGADPCSAGEH